MSDGAVSTALSDDSLRSAMRNTISIAIFEASMLRRIQIGGVVHTLSCREGVRATAGLPS